MTEKTYTITIKQEKFTPTRFGKYGDWSPMLRKMRTNTTMTLSEEDWLRRDGIRSSVIACFQKLQRNGEKSKDLMLRTRTNGNQLSFTAVKRTRDDHRKQR